MLRGFLWFVCCLALVADEPNSFGLVIHGGAGTLSRDKMSAEREAAYRQKLRQALEVGYAILQREGSAVDAVAATIVVMEDSPLFNAGKGAVFTYDETNEMDASIMDGQGMAGAVAGVTRVKNPILLAKGVMLHSPHVLMAAEGADAFALYLKLERVDPSYFRTERRLKQLKDAKNKKKDWTKFGTVGVAALDRNGHLAAGTSTGGLTNKRFGRVGDSPIIGAGTYARDGVCAVSCTGQGEYFIRNVIAYDCAALMSYRKLTVQQAADEVIKVKLTRDKGKGGLIAMDANGRIAMSFNTDGMFRGMKMSDGRNAVHIFAQE